MKFQPKTEKELAEANLLPAGEYDFEVLLATNKTSSKGNEMIELKLNVFDHEGNGRIIFDYLMEAVGLKLRHAAECIDAMDRYDSGELTAADFDGKAGKLKLGIQKDKTGQYPDKNSVADYFPKNKMQASAPKQPPATTPAAPAINDEIPF